MDLDDVVAAADQVPIAAGNPSLLIPRITTGHALGLAVPARAPAAHWMDQYVSVYLVCDDYMPDYLALAGVNFEPETWANRLIDAIPRDQLVRAITTGMQVAADRGDKLQEWTEYVLDHVDPRLKAIIVDRLSSGDAERSFLARQPLLRAMRLVLTRQDAPLPPRVPDVWTVVTLLSHYATREAHPPQPTEPMLGGYRESLAMEIVQNSYFNEADDFGDLLARHRELWTTYEPRLSRYTPREPLRRMLEEACGLDLDDLLTIAFACFSHAREAALHHVRELELGALQLPQQAIDTFLARFSSTMDELAAEVTAHPGEWEFLAYEDRPLIRVGRTRALVTDSRLLLNRVTSGLYWMVHDHEREIYGNSARIKWTQTYSELVELRAEDQLRRLAPVVLGGGSAFFTEEDLKPLGGSVADAGIDFGPVVLLTDIVQHQMTVPTRQLGDARAFRSDMQASVMKKAKQLDGSARTLLAKGDHADNPLHRRPNRIRPAVIQGAAFPVNVITLRDAKQQCDTAGYFSEPEVDDLLIVTMAELEMVEGLVFTQRVQVTDLLDDWRAQQPDLSLRNYIISIYGGMALRRPPATQSMLDEQFDIITGRLQHLDPEGAAGR